LVYIVQYIPKVLTPTGILLKGKMKVELSIKYVQKRCYDISRIPNFQYLYFDLH